MWLSRKALIVISVLASVVVLAVLLLVLEFAPGGGSHESSVQQRSTSTTRPRFTSRQAACEVEADVASDVLVAGRASNSTTDELVAALGVDSTGGGTVMQIAFSGFAAYNVALQPPTNASSEDAALAITRNNGKQCVTRGNPILTRRQVMALTQLVVCLVIG